jgi:hypothetical protein
VTVIPDVASAPDPGRISVCLKATVDGVVGVSPQAAAVAAIAMVASVMLIHRKVIFV